ncbi:MAG: threonylcarbamoyl-AMP synthase [Lachnospiraceae bacterium]|jgi:L-threonylcarbamoyladenylate synthase|nr:threonylcarbamoyl-AMP synthase [Lachnospiraceae bacterium]MCI9058438.1 threonylcarbamoyl-AMP synthase [Lachnospiraceae bacterium]GFI29300.1 threonylcarbamoyl-AMP synthase [Lachnospiraceae bacterium]
METAIVNITDDRQGKEAIREKIHAAGQLIRQGGLVAFPTETVYGLGADALNPLASERIYKAKGRPSDNPLIIHISNLEDLDQIVTEVPKQARKLADKFWPGPLTMIFEKSDIVPLETTGGLQTVAVRMPDHPAALLLIQSGGGFIAAPSANTSGKPSPTRAEHVAEDMRGRIPMILDGGPVGIGIESTIVDFSEKIPMILRPGYITAEMIQEVIGEIRIDPGLASENEEIRPKAPGMKYRHYAPRADLILVSGPKERVQKKINELAKKAAEEGKSAGIIGTEETRDGYRYGIVKSIGTRTDADSIARHLYGILREFDQLDVEIIYSESFSASGIGQAIRNRMLKAAGHQVIEV